MMKNTSEEINFQPCLDSVKQRKIPWNKFEKFMKDLTTYLDCERLKKLNAILLTELTIYYSDLDRLKYQHDGCDTDKLCVQQHFNFIIQIFFQSNDKNF